MKHSIIMLALLFFCYCQLDAQENTEDNTKKYIFKLGGNIGVNHSKYSSVSGINIAFLRKIGDKIFVGATTGYYDYKLLFPSSNNKLNCIPLAATGQYSILKNIFVGLDVGVGYYYKKSTEYSIGFLFEPKLGYQQKDLEVYIAYKKSFASTEYFDINQGYICVGLNFIHFKKNILSLIFPL